MSTRDNKKDTIKKYSQHGAPTLFPILMQHPANPVTLRSAWNLWEQEEKKKTDKGWETGKPEQKPDAYKIPEPSIKDSALDKNTRLTKTETPSGINALELEKMFVPGKDKDSKIMQLRTEIAELEESLMKLELLPESMMTPDAGTNILGRSLFTGAAVEPPNGYGSNFDADPMAPEQQNQSYGNSSGKQRSEAGSPEQGSNGIKITVAARNSSSDEDSYPEDPMGDTASAGMPPGDQRNWVSDPMAPEEGSGFQDSDSSGAIIAKHQFFPR